MKNSPLRKIAFIIILALLIPVLSYTIYQFAMSNKNEELIKSIYARQLETILFSVNQHCWDIFSSWSADISAVARTDENILFGLSRDPALEKFVQKYPAVFGAFIRYNSFNVSYGFSNPEKYFANRSLPADLSSKINRIIQNAEAELKPIIRRAKDGYVKPIAVSWENDNSENITLLFFPAILPEISDESIFIGLFVADLEYIADVVARKIASMNEGQLVFAIKDKKTDEVLFETEESFAREEFEKSESLWILPDLNLEVKITGTTLDAISESRSRTNLIFLVIMNVILLSGAYYLLRNVSAEMVLAKMKTDFVANVSHELRTPLALIRMFAETLELGRVVAEEKKKAYYHSIVGESTRLTQLINNILDFSRIESHKKEYHLRPADITWLVQQTVDMYSFHLEQKGFCVNWDIEPNLPHVNVDEEAFKQSLVNLLDNAVKFSPDDKNIHISISKQNQKIALAVRDNGIGIPLSEHKKIFEKFYRVESSLVHNTKGSGLGLNLVKNIMDIHRGQVTVDSKPGKGSTFTLWFPVHKN